MTRTRGLLLAAVGSAVAVPLLARLAPRESTADGPTVLAVADADSLRARRLADSLFAEFGAPLDSVVHSGGDLRLVLRAGALARSPRVEGGACVQGEVSDRAMRRLARHAYAQYGRAVHVQRVAVVAGRDSAAARGWGRAIRCRSSMTIYEYRASLDAAAASDAG